jgi:DNA-binding winged helix-turn-helix (wHTH) protein
MTKRGRQVPFQFGPWRADPARCVLLGADGREARLEPKLMDLLTLFAGSGGRVLDKDEIVEVVWGGRAIGDDTLAAAVSRLRRALGETSERRYIETVPKRGYRTLIDGAELVRAQSAERPRGPAEAQALIEQGRRAMASPLPSSLAQARLSFEAAVREAPGWAPAHQGLADAMIAARIAGQGEADPALAKAAARAAVGLDDSSAAAWSSLGMALLLADRDFAEADQAFLRALSLYPDSALTRRRRAFALATVGRFIDAERELRKAVELQPSSLEIRGDLLQVLLAARRYRHAASEAAAVIAMAPTSAEAWYGRGWALVFSGEAAEGMDALMRGLELWGADAAQVAKLRATFDREGLVGVSRAAADLFAQQQLLFARRLTDVAMLRAIGGQADEAFAALEAAAERDNPVLLFFPWLPHFDALRADPRYAEFLKRLRLVR